MFEVISSSSVRGRARQGLEKLHSAVNSRLHLWTSEKTRRGHILTPQCSTVQNCNFEN